MVNVCDKKGKTALWYAIKYRLSDAAILLIEKGATFNTRAKDKDNNDGNTAFHEACLAGLSKVIQKMLKHSNGSVNWKGYLDATPLHAACKTSQLEVVEILIKNKANIAAKDNRGKTPLHAAASGDKVDGTIETVDYLLKKGATKILNLQSTEKKESKNALSSACFYGHHETAKFLLSKGAVLEPIAMKYAVEKDFRYTVKVLIESSQWRNGLRQNLNGGPIINEIIRKMPDIAIDILDKCTIRSSQTTENKLRVAFNFEFLESFKESDRSSFEDDRLPEESDYDTDDPARLAKLHAKKDIAKKEKEFEDVIKQKKQYFGPRWGVKSYKKSLHPLYVMVTSKNYHLLTHPVVRALLHHKWIPYGVFYDMMNLLLFVLFLIFTTSLSLAVATPLSPDCLIQGNGSTEGNETCTDDCKFQVKGSYCSPCKATEMPLYQSCSGIQTSRQHGVNFDSAMTIIFAAICIIIRLGKELIRVVRLQKTYFNNFNILKWVDIPCYVLSIAFASVVFNCPCPSVKEWQVGIAGIFLSWITFLRYINKLPGISIYVLMLWKIIQSFVKVAFSIGIPLIFGFAWAFYMALYDPKVLRSPFQNPCIAIASVLSMTIGNFDFDNTFRRDSSGERDVEEELPYLPITYIVWIVFIILMPVLLNNLLVGLAIGDIESVKDEAKLRNLVLKVELVLEFEELLPSCVRSKLRSGCSVINPYPRAKKYKWFSYRKPKHLDEVFNRKYDAPTQDSVKHVTKQSEQYHELQQRLERIEKLLKDMSRRRRL